MKPTPNSGAAGDHNPTGIPTGLDRKARRAVYAARSDSPHGGAVVVKAGARLYLDKWTNGKLHYNKEITPIVDDAYAYLTGE